MWILMAGLPGSGKTTLARELAPCIQGVILNKDAIRSALFPPELIEYSARQDDFCMDLLVRTATYLSLRGNTQPIIFDGRTFSRALQIQYVTEAAAALHQPWTIIECVCSEETARARLAHDEAAGLHLAQNRNFALYRKIRSTFEEIPQPKLVIDTDETLELCVSRALHALIENDPA